MQIRVLALAIACSATCVVVAADFWDAKPFLEWSDKEAEKLLTDSPWSAIVAVPLPNVAPVPSADSTGARGDGGGGRGGRGDDGFGPGPRRVRLTISWRSALPLKQAVARQQAGKGGTLSAEYAALLAQEEEMYVVAIQGLPPQYTRTGPDASIEAVLRRSGKPPIPAARAAAQMARGGALLFIAFPRTDPIVGEDGDVDVDVKIGGLSIRKKFKLKEMVFQGRLAL